MRNEQAVRLVSAMIHTALDRHGYVGAELCRQTGLSPATLSRSRQGLVKIPMRYQQDICNLLPSLNNRRFTKALQKQYV